MVNSWANFCLGGEGNSGHGNAYNRELIFPLILGFLTFLVTCESLLFLINALSIFLPKVSIMTSSCLKFTIQLSINYLPLSPCPLRSSYHTLSGKILEFSTDITSNHSLLNSEKMVFNFNCGHSAIYTVKTNIYQLTSHIQAGS